MSDKKRQEEVKRKYPSCSAIPFEYVAFFFTNVSKVHKAALKKKHLASFRMQYVNRDADDIFQLYRLLLPALDRVRGSYGLKESLLGSSLIKACGIPESAEAAKAVRDWKKPPVEFAGDFAAVVEYYLLVPNCGREEGTLRSAEYTVGQLNGDLDRLARAEDRSEKAAALKSMIMRTTPKQMKWIVHIILGYLRIGLSENLALSDFHEDAVKLYDSTMDLQKVCMLLKDRTIRHQIKDIEPGIPARSQLAARKTSPQAILGAMNVKDFVVEIKFDGERCQLHKAGDEVMYFSRRGIEHGDTSSYRIFNAAAKRQLLKENCILDGELVVWNRVTGCYEPFGSLRPTVHAAMGGTVAGASIEYEDFRDEGSERRVHQLPDLDQLEFQYIAFDILYVDDRSVTALPLSERHKLLRASIKDAPLKGFPLGGGLSGRLVPLLPDVTILGGHCLSKKGQTVEDIAEMFNKALIMQEEGIVAKALDSPWTMNDRSGNWVKMKPDYVSNHEVDALVIGGYYGTRRQASRVSEFLLGILDTSTHNDGRYVSFCRVGTGMSDKERSQLESIVDPLFKRTKKAPKHYRVTGHHKETPDEWITNPSASAVVQVKADIRTIPSDVFAAGYTLRFPRVACLRMDKGYEDIMTLQELIELVQIHGGHLHQSKRPFSTPLKSTRTKRRIVSVPPRFQQTPVKARRRTSTCLTGLVICFSDYGTYGKEKLESTAQELGAVVYMSPSRCVSFVVGVDPSSQELQRLAHDGKYDIVSADWLLRCEQENARIPLRPRDYLSRATHAANRLGNLLAGEDPSIDPEAEDIQQVVEHHLDQYTIRIKHESLLENPLIDCPEIPIQSLFPKSSLLQGCCCCVISFPITCSDPLAGCPSLSSFDAITAWKDLRSRSARSRLESKLLLHGSELSDELTPSVTHVVFDDSCEARMKTSADFLSWYGQQHGSENSFEWLYEALTTGKLFLIRSDSILQLDHLELLKESVRVNDHLPSFAMPSFKTNSTTKERQLCVDDWPWENYAPDIQDVLRSPNRELIGSGRVSSKKTASTEARLVGSVRRKVRKTSTRPSRYRTPEEKKERFSTPSPKRLKGHVVDEPCLEPEGFSATSSAVHGTRSRSGEKLPSFFEAILGESEVEEGEAADPDLMELDAVSSPSRKRGTEVTASPKRTRMRLRKDTLDSPEGSETTTKKVSIKDRLRSLKKGKE